MDLRREPLSLIEVVRQAAETSRPMVEQAGHRLTAQLPDCDCIANADETRLIQVLSNLINNAAKFTPRGGSIEVSLRCEAQMAVVTVRDNGIGIPREMLDRVFDMFTQVQRSHAHVGGGLGIGLTLVRQLVERHGGSVVAHSGGAGQGSEFVVRLPLAEPALAALAPDRSLPSGFVASGLRVLVADDNVDAAESLSMLLELSGNEVRTATDGLQALEIAEAFQPHAMLVDIAMPGLNGHELCRKVRELPWGPGVLMIAASGWGAAGGQAPVRCRGLRPSPRQAVGFRCRGRLAGRREPRRPLSRLRRRAAPGIVRAAPAARPCARPQTRPRARWLRPAA